MFRKTVLGLGAALMLASAIAPTAASAAQNHGNKNHGHHGERHGKNNGGHHGYQGNNGNGHHGTWKGGPRIKVTRDYTPVGLGRCYTTGVRTYDPLTKKTVCG